MFAQNLKRLRKSRGWTQEELARRAGLSFQAISHWEKGIRHPMMGTVLALAAALDCDPKDLYTAPVEPPVAACA